MSINANSHRFWALISIHFDFLFSCPDRVCGQPNRWHCHWLTHSLTQWSTFDFGTYDMSLNVRKLPRRLSLTMLKQCWNFLKILTFVDTFGQCWQFWTFSTILTIFIVFDNFYHFIVFDNFDNFWQFWQFLEILEIFTFFTILTIVEMCWQFYTILTIFDNFDIYGKVWQFLRTFTIPTICGFVKQFWLFGQFLHLQFLTILTIPTIFQFFDSFDTSYKFG